MQLTDAQSAGADVVFLPIYYQPASIIFAQADAMGYEPTFFGVDGMDGILTLKNFDMSLAEGVMVLTPFSADATDERTVNFVTKYSEQFGETPNQFAADGYDCIYALKQAMENAGCTPDMSAEDICDAMIEQFTTMSFDASPAPASPGAPTARQQDANGCRDSRRRVCQRRKRRLKTSPPRRPPQPKRRPPDLTAPRLPGPARQSRRVCGVCGNAAFPRSGICRRGKRQNEKGKVRIWSFFPI